MFERPGTVLIIDDSEDIREILSIVLVDAGYEVAQAIDGRDALGQLEAGLAKNGQLPSVILLDYMMPVMNGVEFRRAQFAHQRLNAIPVVLMMAASTLKDLLNDVRPNAVLRKPVGYDELLDALSALGAAP